MDVHIQNGNAEAPVYAMEGLLPMAATGESKTLRTLSVPFIWYNTVSQNVWFAAWQVLELSTIDYEFVLLRVG